MFAKSAAMLGNVEEHTTLSRALSQLAETEEKIETVQKQQADTDFYVLAELLKDYIALIGSVKVSVASVCWVDDLPETRMMITKLNSSCFLCGHQKRNVIYSHCSMTEGGRIATL